MFFDVPIEIARARLANNSALDRFEQEKGDFFERVRAAYYRRVAESPARYAVIDAAQSIENVQRQLLEVFKVIEGE